MNLDDLKEKLQEAWDEFVSRLEDSPAYNSLKEKFEALTPNAQKGAIWGGIVLCSLVMLSCPMSYWSDSSDFIEEYDEKRGMIRDLLRASHLAGQTGNLPIPMNLGAMTSQVQRILDSSRLLPEQMQGINPIDAAQLGAPLAPPNILQEAIEVSLNKLNIKQAVDIGYELQGMNDAVKLAGLDIAANPTDDHYFNVKYRLIKFSLPADPTPEENDSKRKNRRGEDN